MGSEKILHIRKSRVDQVSLQNHFFGSSRPLHSVAQRIASAGWFQNSGYIGKKHVDSDVVRSAR